MRNGRKISNIVIYLAMLAFVTVMSQPAMSGSYPDRVVRILVGYSPGLTANDALARILAPKLQEALKQPFIVENKPGAAGLIAEEFVARSPADGYTILSGTSAITVNAGLRKGYTSHKTLKPVAIIASSPVFLFTRANSSYHSVADIVAAAKANPDKLSFGTTGVGSSAHLVMEIFQAATGTKLKHVPYKGAGDVMSAVLGGEIDFRVAPFVPGDSRFNALLVMDTHRFGLAPDVPSASEAGLNGFFETFYGTVLMVPVDTPNEIVDLLYQKTKEGLADTPELRKQLAASGNEVMVLSPAKSTELMNNGVTGWTNLIQRLGITME